MGVDSVITMDGTVVNCLPGAKFKVKLENGAIVVCTLSGKMRMNNISILKEDNVTIRISVYDLTKGVITYRNK